MKKYNAQYIESTKKLLAQKLPIYADKKKGPEFVKILPNTLKRLVIQIKKYQC